MTVNELVEPINTAAVSAVSDNSDISVKQKISKSIIDRNSVIVSEMMNSTYNTSTEIIKNMAPSEEELKLRERRKKEVRKQELDKKIKTEEELEKEIEKEELNDELTAKVENLI